MSLSVVYFMNVKKSSTFLFLKEVSTSDIIKFISGKPLISDKGKRTRQSNRLLLFFSFQKKMNPFSDSFAFCYSILYAISVQLIVSFFIKSNTCPYINGIIYLWSACAWTQFLSPHFQAHINYIKCTLKSQPLCQYFYFFSSISTLSASPSMENMG